MRIRPMAPGDAADVLKIHAEGIATGDATFDTDPGDWPTFDQHHLPQHRFIAETDGELLGWIATAATSHRPVYRGVVSHSVYVATHARGRGVGSALLERLIQSTQDAGVWTIRCGIFPDNTASLALHDKHGFRIVGISERIGRTHTGQWRDVAQLERRSAIIGID